MRSTVQEILNQIKTHKSDISTLIITIDGHGGSGKSFLAKELAKFDPTISIIHFDDFYCAGLQRNTLDKNLPQFDWQRLEKEVLIPVCNNKNSKYQRFDWELNKLNDWIEVSTGKTIIIEGVYSLNKRLQKYYDFKIWVDCPLEIRLQRAKARDEECRMNTMDLWLNDWIPRENNYVLNEKPFNSANLIIDGSGLYADIELGEFNTLESSEIK
jgi:uridine kinase